MNKPNEFSPEARERAVRMVQEHRGAYPAPLYETMMAMLLFGLLWAMRRHPFAKGRSRSAKLGSVADQQLNRRDLTGITLGGDRD